MRIGLDGRYIQDQYHGIGRYIYEVAYQLAQSYPDELVIFHNPSVPNTRFDLEALGRSSNVRLVKTGLPLFWPQQQLFWPGLLQKAQLDLFHTPFFDAPYLASCPVLVTIHDLIFDRYPDYMPQSHFRLYYRLLTHLSVRKATQIITVSEATKRDLVELYGVASAKISVTPEAAASHFHPVAAKEAETVRMRYNLPDRFVLTVGTMRPQKNIPTLVKAFAQIAPETDGALVLAGKADHRWADEVTPLIRELNLQERIIQPGHIAEADLPALYTLADCFAFPSIIEGFGLPALEAMACGTAVIVSNKTSLPEVVGDAGLLVDPYDVQGFAEGLLKILQNRSFRRQLEHRSLMRARKFSWDRTAHLTMETYQAALGITIPTHLASTY
ncbi:MAG: glycosyltransferase family 4 protein [Ardenticatenaceae bacterium]